MCVWRKINCQQTWWMLNWIWHVFHLKFSKASNRWKNYILATSDDQIWPEGYRKIFVRLPPRVVCAEIQKSIFSNACTISPILLLYFWWVIYGSVDTWDSQILGNPTWHLITGITADECPPKTSRRTPFCHNFTSTAIMTMINWPSHLPVCGWSKS